MEWKLITTSQTKFGRKAPKGDPFYYSRRKIKNDRDVLRITIPEPMMRKMRWVIGDKVTVLRDDDARLGLVKRVVNGSEQSWTLTAMGSSKKASTGTIRRSCVQITLEESDLAQVFVNGEKVRIPDNTEITNEGILFDLPRK